MDAAMTVYTNVSTYKFAVLDDLPELRARLLRQCSELELKGTILISKEGVNLFVAGLRANVDVLLDTLRRIPGLEDLTPKYSESNHQPFNRMLVRIKKEIIAFGVEGINPARRTSPKLSPKQLKQWLDEGKPITLYDTRNDYEVKMGTFKGAVPAGIHHFRDFPDAVRKLPTELKEQPIVMFCTGGIRCEKAGPFMEREGFKKVFQLDGGILKYFEECGSDHYDGECFVFDQRVGVDPRLNESGAKVCFNCLEPLTQEEQQHPHYQPPHSCPHCYTSSEEQMVRQIARRNEALRRAANPLPGSVPIDNFRPLNVAAKHHGKTLLEYLCALFPHIEEGHWIDVIQKGRILDIEKKPLGADTVVKDGERLLQLQPEQIEPDVNGQLEVIFENDLLVVLNKPAPLPMHPAGRYNRNTLRELLHAAYAPLKPRPVHRLDANTTGLVVCARTHQLTGSLQTLFSKGEVQKTYLARVQGVPEQDAFVCDAPIGAEPVATGCRVVDEAHGLAARTEFKVLSRNKDNGTALLEVRPITGRTNQIRVHLWHLGIPVCGDPSYLPNHAIGEKQTLDLDDSPLCLHAWKLAFTHPVSKRPYTFEAPLPEWAREIS